MNSTSTQVKLFVQNNASNKFFLIYYNLNLFLKKTKNGPRWDTVEETK